MAEMTTEQVKTLLESFAAVCGSNSKAKELCSDAIKFVEQQAQEIAAANARIAELEQQQFAGQTWVTFDEHMKALKKIKQMEDAIKFDFERFMEFQQRAEQAEAQCAYWENIYKEITNG